MTLALIGAIVAEFVGAQDGLGVLLTRFQFQLDMASGFAIVLVLAVIGLLLYGVVAAADRKVVFWRRADAQRSA